MNFFWLFARICGRISSEIAIWRLDFLRHDKTKEQSLFDEEDSGRGSPKSREIVLPP